MVIRQIIWKDHFVEKPATKRGISTEEVGDVLNSKPLIRKVSKGKVKGENIYPAFGQTIGGRYMVIFYIRKSAGSIVPVRVRDMDDKERKLLIPCLTRSRAKMQPVNSGTLMALKTARSFSSR